MHWTEMEPRHDDENDECVWVECPVCGDEYDIEDYDDCPFCGQ